MNKKVVICRYTISETNAIFMNLTHAIAKEIPDKKYLEVYPENSNISDNLMFKNEIKWPKIIEDETRHDYRTVLLKDMSELRPFAKAVSIKKGFYNNNRIFFVGNYYIK